MKLSQILLGLDYTTHNFYDTKIQHITCETAQVTANSLYFCVRGQNIDGHTLVNTAIKSGAVAVVVDHILKDLTIPQIVVSDVRSAMGIMASNFYHNPRSKFKLIGVTGTNGKTTTTYMLKSILETAGYKVGLIGTICNMIGEQKFESTLTTPDPIELHKIFMQMAKAKVDYVVMEVSAHAIAFNKMAGVVCDAGILTNITQDHLDFFGTFENYRDTKLRFLTDEFCKIKVANIDDDNIREYVLGQEEGKIATFGLNNPCDCFATRISYAMVGTSYLINLNDELRAVNTRLIGEFNLYNGLGAGLCCLKMGIDSGAISLGLSTCDFVSGRCNIIKLNNGAFAVIDYAHTPDGLKNILKSIRNVAKGKIYSLFGCGGNRDTTKRKIMGEISGELADFTVITSDNPRLEDPQAIILQIEEGIKPKTKNYCCIQNRKEAILTTISKLSPADVLVIAGKGAEDYMDIAGKKIHYSDFEVLQEINK